MTSFADESDATVFLPKNSKEGNVYVKKHGRDEEVKSWGSQLWHFLVQPFTWISMLSRYALILLIPLLSVLYINTHQHWSM